MSEKIYFETPKGKIVKGMRSDGKIAYHIEWAAGFGPTFTQAFEDAQSAFAQEVARKMEPYVPWDFGTLAQSQHIASEYKKGLIVYATPYARRQYYTLGYHHPQDGLGLRGPKWGQRCAADNRVHFVQFARAAVREQLKKR